MVDFQRQPHFADLLRALIEKTKLARLRWEETARDNSFLASARGEQTFEIRRVGLWDLPQEERIGFPPEFLEKIKDLGVGNSCHALTVRGRQGEVLFEFVDRLGESPAAELYELACRFATQVDERVDESLKLVKAL